MADENCDYDMDELSEKVFLSKSRLAHVFSAQTGITLKEYLQYKRLEIACRKMLRVANITEAAFDTGFAGSSHIAALKNRLDLSAIQYVFTSHNGFTNDAQRAFRHIKVIPDLKEKGFIFDERPPMTALI